MTEIEALEATRGFALRLHLLRKAYGEATGRPRLTQAAFAGELGLQTARYGRYERGEMQPPLEVLIALRKLTGVSLSQLIAGLPPGRDDIIATPRMPTMGDRLRMAREFMEPDLEQLASYMKVDPKEWTRWEDGLAEAPISKMAVFCQRFSVTLDYLYLGILDGIRKDLRYDLVDRYPILGSPVRRKQRPSTEAGGGTAPISRPDRPDPLRDD